MLKATPYKPSADADRRSASYIVSSSLTNDLDSPTSQKENNPEKAALASGQGVGTLKSFVSQCKSRKSMPPRACLVEFGQVFQSTARDSLPSLMTIT